MPQVNLQKQSISPLMIAAREGHLEIAKFLITKQADVNMVNGNGDTALHISVSGNNYDISALLFNNGADVNCQNKNKITPIMVAAHTGSEAILRLLISRNDANLELGVMLICSNIGYHSYCEMNHF